MEILGAVAVLVVEELMVVDKLEQVILEEQMAELLVLGIFPGLLVMVFSNSMLWYWSDWDHQILYYRIVRKMHLYRHKSHLHHIKYQPVLYRGDCKAGFHQHI